MRIYLVRHASHDQIGKMLCGRSVDPALNERGHTEAAALARSLAAERIDLVQTSPRRRTRETAQAIADRIDRKLEIAAPLDEIDVGEWSGLSFEELAGDESWRSWNARRGSARPPRGESMRELQERIVAHLEAIAALPIRGAVLVSHAEPIRAALMHQRGVALDDFHQIEVAPASISIIDVTPIRNHATVSESLVIA
jgi:ribonuclease H / adenosylcobalamin/alpha-ribazole phosphatase